MRDSEFAAAFFENLTVEVMPPVNLIRATHAIKLHNVGKLMQKHILKQGEGRKNRGTEFDLFLPRVSLASPTIIKFHPFKRIFSKTILLECKAGVKFNFCGSDHLGKRVNEKPRWRKVFLLGQAIFLIITKAA